MIMTRTARIVVAGMEHRSNASSASGWARCPAGVPRRTKSRQEKNRKSRIGKKKSGENQVPVLNGL